MHSADQQATHDSPLTGAISRPRLHDLLDSPLHRVFVVQGPSGSGKTTLARSWLRHRSDDRPVTWISIAPGTTSRHAFWRQVAGSGRRLGGLSDATATEVEQQLNAAADPVATALGVLAGAGPVTWVLDAYEHLEDATAAIDDDLARLVAEVPDLKLVITTRGLTRLADDHELGQAHTRVITLSELAMTPGEIAMLIKSQTGLDAPALATSVAATTHGFPLTVRTMVLALSHLGRIPRVDSREWNDVVAARMETLLPDPVAVQFVVDTSVPPHLDLDLAAALTGHPDPAAMLGSLERNGFGRWIPYARRRPAFQYVETIRDTFRARAMDDAQRFHRACVTSAGWLFANDDVDQALQFAIAGGDFGLADRIFVQLVITNPDTYLTDRFLPALRHVPEDQLTGYPMLAFGLGLALMANPAMRAEAPRIFRFAIDSPVRPSYLEPSVDTFSLDSMRAIARRLALDFAGSATGASVAAAMVDDLSPTLLQEYGEHVGTVLRQLTYSLLLGGRIDEALDVTSRSITLCQTQTSRNYSTVYAAGISAFAGDLARSRALLATIDLAAWPGDNRQSYLNGLGLVAEGHARLDALDYGGALDVLAEAASYLQTAEFWPLLTAISVAARHGLGQARPEAERVTAELRRATAPPAIGDNVATEHLLAALALAWIEAGDLAAAGELLEGRRPASPYLAGARGALLLADGREGEALALLQDLDDAPDHTLRTRAATRTVGAVAALRLGRPEPARDWLNTAAVIFETYGPRAHLALLAPADRRLLWEFGRESGSSSLQRYLDLPGGGRTGRPETAGLTARERVVLRALAEHDSVRSIATALVVSPETIKSQLRAIYRKLGVASRQAALAAAFEAGLLES